MNWIKSRITRQIGLLTAIALIIISSVSLYLNVQFKKYFEQQSKEQLTINSQYISSEIGSFLQKYYVIVNQAKCNPDFVAFASEVTDRNSKKENPLFGRVKMQLQDIAALDKNIALSYIALSKANDLITNDYDSVSIQNYELDKREWYSSTINAGKTTITEPYLDLVTGNITITVASPIRNGEEVLGVFALDIEIDDMSKMMQNYKIGDTGYAAVIYNDGRILYHPDFALHPENRVYLNDIIGDASKEILSGQSGITFDYYEGQERLVSYMPIENTNLVVCTVITKAEVYSRLYTLNAVSLILLVGVLAITFMILVILRKRITTPVVKISKEIEGYSEQSRSISLPENYLIRNDEIGVLARGITLMLAEISNYISEIKDKNQELNDAAEKINLERSLFKTTIHSLADGVISIDNNSKIRIMNYVAEKLTGYSATEATDKDLTEIFRVENNQKSIYYENKNTFMEGEIARFDDVYLINNINEKILIEGSISPVKDEKGTISGSVVIFKDFTEKKKQLDQILYMNYHDHLTGLFNRRFFDDELQRLDKGTKLPLSIAMIDVNGLKLINDAFGHWVGDELLVRVASILKNECRKKDSVARVGGDEFAILFPNTTREMAEIIIDRIYKKIAQEKMGNIVISISIGYDTKTSIETPVENAIIKAEENMYMNKLTESKSMRNKTIQAVFNTLREKNEREKVHCERVSNLSKEIAIAMNFSPEKVKEIEYAGLMHDIGKIILSDEILNKSGELTEREAQEVRRHTESGYQILRSIDSFTSLAEVALYHHERWDGNGYPRGLRGEEIPLFARIITVADAYEAMTAERPYKSPKSRQSAIDELIDKSGSQFDPEIVKILIEKVI